jgi:hypothetical protein
MGIWGKTEIARHSRRELRVNIDKSRRNPASRLRPDGEPIEPNRGKKVKKRGKVEILLFSRLRFYSDGQIMVRIREERPITTRETFFRPNNRQKGFICEENASNCRWDAN